MFRIEIKEIFTLTHTHKAQLQRLTNHQVIYKIQECCALDEMYSRV